MEFAKETRKTPTLVNPDKFKIKKPKVLDPEIIKKNNSKKLNIFVGVGFVLFLIFFLWNWRQVSNKFIQYYIKYKIIY